MLAIRGMLRSIGVVVAMTTIFEGGTMRAVAAGPVGASSTARGAASASPRMRFAVLGDFGSGLPQQRAVARRMCAFRRAHGFGYVFTTGDNIYPDGARKRFRRRFFRPYRCLLDAGVEFKAALGNHDVITRAGRPELSERAFGMEGRNYVVRRHRVRLVVLNSNALRRRWIRRATKDWGQRWTIVLMHHPVYSPGPHGPTPGFRPWLPHLFARRGVDLVLTGHDHLYSVTRPLRRIRYVVTGGGGASLYPCGDAWFTDVCRSRNHFVIVRTGRRFIRVRAVDPDGTLFGRFRTRGR